MTDGAQVVGHEREPYRPSNGSEGMDFMGRWCGRCTRDAAYRAGVGDSCPIAAATMAFGVDEPGYPVEWREDGPEGPRCTAFDDPRTAARKLDLHALANASYSATRVAMLPFRARARDDVKP